MEVKIGGLLERGSYFCFALPHTLGFSYGKLCERYELMLLVLAERALSASYKASDDMNGGY